MRDVRSPITGNNNVKLIKVYETNRLINAWHKEFPVINIEKEFQGCKKIFLYQCQETNVQFFYPSMLAGSENLYSQLQEFDWYYMSDKWEYKVALANLARKEKILELGCAKGAFLTACLMKGLSVTGIEINSKAAKEAQANGLPVKVVDFEEYAFSHRNSIDSICSFQVLEHLPDPKKFIELSLNMLKTNGKLIIGVPNADSFLKYQHNLLDIPPHHMTRWPEKSFKMLEKIFPVKVEKILKEPLAIYHINSYLTSYTDYICSKIQFANLLFNHVTLSFYQQILKSGFNRFLTGQSLYVQIRKQK